MRKLETWHDGDNYHLRVVCRSCFVDVYVDDVLYLSHTYDPNKVSRSGGAGVFYAGVPKKVSVRDAIVRRFNS
jgi:hypothetical protein